MGKGLQIAIAMLTVLGGGAWLASSLSSDAGTVRYFSNVHEYLAELPDAGESSRPSRVHGFVVDGSIAKDLDASRVDFVIHDEAAADTQLAVRYPQIDVPDLFKDGAEVVVEGHYEAGRFVATRVMAKCPSKYESLGETDT